MTISRFNFPPQRSRCLKYLFGILRNNYITCKFLTRCIIIRKHIKPKSFRHAFSAGSFFLCLPVRALRKQQHNLARKGVSGPSIIRLCPKQMDENLTENLLQHLKKMFRKKCLKYDILERKDLPK